MIKQTHWIMALTATRWNDPMFMMRIGMVALLAVGFAFSGCQQSATPPEVKGEAQQQSATPASKAIVQLNPSQIKTMKIQTTSVRQGELPAFLTLTAAVQAIPNKTMRIGTPVSGKIESVAANLEDRVSAGQTLVTLYSNDVGEAQANLLNTLQDLDAARLQAETDLQLAKSTFERETRLYELKVSARADKEAAQANYNKVQRQLLSLKSKRCALIEITDKRLQLLGATAGDARRLAQTKQLQPRVYLKSNVGGIVVNRSANPGEWVDANTEILTIANLDQVWVVAQAFEKDLAYLQVGQVVNIQLGSRPDEEITGKIMAIGSEVHPDTRTLDVRIDVANKHYWLKPNLFARVQVDIGTHNGLMIPRSAVQTFGDEKMVYIQKSPSTYLQKIVQVVNDSNKGDYVLAKGVSLSDPIVTQGAFELHGEWIKQRY